MTVAGLDLVERRLGYYKLYIKQLFIVLFSSILIACAGTEETPAADAFAHERRGSDCISQGSIRDYRVLDDSNLIVTGSHRQKYHVVLSQRAFGLRSTWQIGFRSPSGRVCAGFSDLIVDDGLGPESIRIHRIRALTPGDEEDLLIRFGKMEPAVKQAPEPREVKGAEVEELD